MNFPCPSLPTRSCLAILCLLGAELAVASIAVTPQNTALHADWHWDDVDDPLLLQQSFCVESIRGGGGGGGGPGGGGPPGGGGGGAQPYDVTLNTPLPVALFLGADNELAVSLTWVDTTTGTSYPLQPNQTTARELDGTPTNCDNARLDIAITKAALAAAHPGLYERDFQITLSQEEVGATPHSQVVTISASVFIPDRIRLSGLQDIDLGRFDGQNDISVTDGVCVYRASGANYRVILRGDGPSDSFRLSGGSGQLAYSALWNGQQVTPLDPLPGQPADAFGGDTNCNGASNASLAVEVSAADALAVSSGTYTGVLTITVEME